MVNININMVNMAMHSIEKITNRIFGRITSPEILTKSIFVYTKFKFDNFFNNTNFSDTDQTQTKNTNPNHNFFLEKIIKPPNVSGPQ